jgi:hypothetical protein
LRHRGYPLKPNEQRRVAAQGSVIHRHVVVVHGDVDADNALSPAPADLGLPRHLANSQADCGVCPILRANDHANPVDPGPAHLLVHRLDTLVDVAVVDRMRPGSTCRHGE